MIRQLVLAVFLIAAVVFLATCKDDSANPNNYELPSYILGDLVHFDTNDYTIVERVRPNEAEYARKEPFVYYEKSVGEPFYDLDGNGVYNEETDLFILTVSAPYEDSLFINCGSFDDTTCLPPYEVVDDTSLGWDRVYRYTYYNQDLNRNGKHDAPDEDWMPGCPFDDWDGNGTFDKDLLQQCWYCLPYQPGFPYADLNGNGQYDSLLDRTYEYTRWNVTGGQDLNALIRPAMATPSPYRFMSDSGLAYDLQLYKASSGGLAFHIDSAGFWRDYSPRDVLIFSGTAIQPENNIEHVFVCYSQDNVEFQIRDIIFNETLAIDGQTFTGLVRSDVEYNLVHLGDTTRFVTHYWFQPNGLHLLAAAESAYGDTTNQTWYYLHKRLDAASLPLSTRR